MTTAIYFFAVPVAHIDLIFVPYSSVPDLDPLGSVNFGLFGSVKSFHGTGSGSGILQNIMLTN
jgi:hypothetical protein